MKSPLFGLLLAGGRSTRMGRNKASMVIGADGLNQGQRAVQGLLPVCQKVFLSLRDAQTAPEGCEHLEIVRDNPSISGPLAGILAAFEREPDAAWLVMACDLPFVTPRSSTNSSTRGAMGPTSLPMPAQQMDCPNRSARFTNPAPGPLFEGMRSEIICVRVTS